MLGGHDFVSNRRLVGLHQISALRLQRLGNGYGHERGRHAMAAHINDVESNMVVIQGYDIEDIPADEFAGKEFP